MSSDLIGRRRAVEQRLDRARALELSLIRNTEILAEATGMSVEQFDFDGSFRAALTAMAAVAARRTRFDVIITLPDAPFGVRIQHLNNVVSAEVVVQRDGPYESLSAAGSALLSDQAVTGGPDPGPAADQVASDLAALLWQGVDDLPT